MIEHPKWEKAWSPGYTVIGYVDENSIVQKTRVDAFVRTRGY